MENKIKICHVCERPVEECVCCAECGHICSLDYGEPYCPVCFPEKQPDNPNNAALVNKFFNSMKL